MANESKSMLTAEGLKKYEEELLNLKTQRRKEVAQKIKVAREQGDLSENADYDAAKDEQTEIENRIAELEELLKHAEVVFDHEIDQTRVNVGCTVTVYDNTFEEEITYRIVGSSEADSRKKMISNESPVGAALIGKTEGMNVVVDLGDSELSLDILKVEF